MSIGVLGAMPSAASLLGLPVIGVSALSASTGASNNTGASDNSGTSTVPSTSAVGTSLVWSRGGSQQLSANLTWIQGVYVGAGNSPVSAKLAEKFADGNSLIWPTCSQRSG